MDIKLLKSLSEDLIKITQELQERVKDPSFTNEEFLQFIKNIKEQNDLILEELDLPTDSWQ